MAEPDDGVLTALLLAFRDFAQPVIDACASREAMEFFWYRHGWRISLDDSGFTQVSQVLPIGPVGRELEQVADAVAAQRDSGGPPSPDDVLRLADAVATLAETLPRSSRRRWRTWPAHSARRPPGRTSASNCSTPCWNSTCGSATPSRTRSCW